MIRNTLQTFVATALLAGVSAPGATPAGAQSYLAANAVADAREERSLDVPNTPGLRKGGYVIVIDVTENRLHFTRDRRVLWSAPVGTGTGLRLETDKDAWHFSTPNGVFHVQHKAENPDWYAEDWYYLENKLPIPPRDSPKRLFPGGLGAAAVYIGNGLAIHGTDKPQLIGQRVSHGCIRLSNRDALRLYHSVQVGTEVVIVGQAPADSLENAAEVSRRASPARAPRDPYLQMLETAATSELVQSLDEELEVSGAESRWAEVTGALIRRAQRDDDAQAVRAVLELSGRVRGLRAKEWEAFVADMYQRRPLAVLEQIGDMERGDGERIARTLVTALSALYPGSMSDSGAPLPTRRLPREALDGRGDAVIRGWDTVAEAESRLGDRGNQRVALAPTS